MALLADIGPVVKLGFCVTGGLCNLAVCEGGGGGCDCPGCGCCCAICDAPAGGDCCCGGGDGGDGRPAREASSNFFSSLRSSCGCFDIATRFLSEILSVSGRFGGFFVSGDLSKTVNF